MVQAVMGFHMNPLLALCLVVGLIFITPWCLAKIKTRLPRMLAQADETARSLVVKDVLPLGPKRRLFSVSVRVDKSRYETALILTGGPSDLFLGWVPTDAAPLHKPLDTPVNNAQERRASASDGERDGEGKGHLHV